AGTTRMPQASQQPSESEPATTRLTIAAKNAARAVINNAAAITQRTPRAGSPPPTAPPSPAPPTPPTPPQRDREIESWLGELRGTASPEPPAAQQSADATEAIPTAPKPPQPDQDSTEKLPQQGQKPADEERRRGGGVSAQDLLRREGRL